MGAILTAGGRKDPSKFIPALNVSYSFGGDEEYFDDLNRIDKLTTSKSEVKFDGNKVRLIAGSDIDEIYTDAQGRMKWDVVFEKCPESMVLEWRRTCSPGLSAYYQPALTDEEIKEGSHRPPDVEGSYAIYCDKAHNWIRPLNRKREIPRDWKAQLSAGAALADVNISAYREYKTGKIAHHYRPFVVDANGRTEWCTLLIVENVERVTLPKKFMATAKYPVRLDPTIGYTSAGGTQYGSSGYVKYGNINITASSDGTADTLYLYAVADGDGYTRQLYVGYYSDDSGPDAAIERNLSVQISDATPSWRSASLDGGTIVSGNKYYPTLLLACGINNAWAYYDAISESCYTETIASMPETASGTLQDRRFSIYLDYTESGGAVANSYYYMMNQ